MSCVKQKDQMRRDEKVSKALKIWSTKNEQGKAVSIGTAPYNDVLAKRSSQPDPYRGVLRYQDAA